MSHVDGSIQTLTCCSLLSDADTDEKFSKVSRKINFFAGIIVRVYLYTILLLVQNVMRETIIVKRIEGMIQNG